MTHWSPIVGAVGNDDTTVDGGADELVFRALADPSRRRLLDALHADDGLTLTQLGAVLPDLTRFGVMKHLRVLEEADLVLSEKVGRSKHHYLNPVPIQRIHSRWLSKYGERSGQALLDLATAVEAGPGPEREERR